MTPTRPRGRPSGAPRASTRRRGSSRPAATRSWRTTSSRRCPASAAVLGVREQAGSRTSCSALRANRGLRRRRRAPSRRPLGVGPAAARGLGSHAPVPEDPGRLRPALQLLRGPAGARRLPVDALRAGARAARGASASGTPRSSSPACTSARGGGIWRPARSLAELLREAVERRLVGRLRLSSIESQEFPMEALVDPAISCVALRPLPPPAPERVGADPARR